MFAKCAALLFLLGLISFSGAVEENSTTVYVAPTYVNVTSDGLVMIDKNIYYIEDKQYLNWFDARAYCDNLGADLISLDTDEKSYSINQYLDSVNSKVAFWTSGNHLMKLGNHVWLPSGRPVASNLWAPGEPNNHNRGEHCDDFRCAHSLLTMTMNDLNCLTKLNFICEFTCIYN